MAEGTQTLVKRHTIGEQEPVTVRYIPEVGIWHGGMPTEWDILDDTACPDLDGFETLLEAENAIEEYAGRMNDPWVYYRIRTVVHRSTWKEYAPKSVRGVGGEHWLKS